MDALRALWAVIDLIIAIKRPRPEEWTVDSPPPKRMRFNVFEEVGAKAPRLYDNHVMINVIQ
jgi:hypothetical protein